MNHILYNRINIANYTSIPMNVADAENREYTDATTNTDIDIAADTNSNSNTSSLLSLHTTDIIRPIITPLPPSLGEGEADTGTNTGTNTGTEIMNRDNPYKNETCIICLESIKQISKSNYEYLIDLNHTEIYHKTCHCRYYVHYTCMEQTKLYSRIGRNNVKCIICSSLIRKNENFLDNIYDMEEGNRIINRYIHRDGMDDMNNVFENRGHAYQHCEYYCNYFCDNIYVFLLVLTFLVCLIVIFILY